MATAPCIEFADQKSTFDKGAKIHPLAAIRSASRGAATLSDDGLTTYMNQIRRIEVLPRETQDELARAYNDGDIEAGKTLIWSNLRLVIKIARDFHHSGQDLMDLIQEGNLGLAEALSRFDPERGTPFVGYAHFWIRAMILNHLLNNTRPVRLGSSRDSRKLFFNLKKARRAVVKEGLEPTFENVAEYLDVHVNEVIRMSTLMDTGGVVYLDAPVYSENQDTTGIDILPSNDDAPDLLAEERIFRTRFVGLVESFKKTLPDSRRVAIWEERMIAAEPLQLKELGEKFEVSKERIRQLEMDIRRRFSHYLEAELGDELLEYMPR